jgi:hypothetical protein
LLYGLGIGALLVSVGCGETGSEGTRGELTEQIKKQTVGSRKKMAEYYAAKKAAPQPGKGRAR